MFAGLHNHSPGLTMLLLKQLIPPLSLQNQNILSAVLTLVQELDHTSLLSLRKEIDQQIQDYNQTESECLEENGPLEEKEVIAD